MKKNEINTEIEFPEIAQVRIKELQVEIGAMQARLQEFIDGVLIGMSVDVMNSSIAVDLHTMKATVSPKVT